MLFFKGWFIWGELGEILLWVAGILTFYTGYQYFAKSLEYIKQENSKKAVLDKPVEKKIVAAPKTVKKPVRKTATKAKK